jgi:RNA polymerase sigma-70 factor (ECF subfamily)
MPDDDPALLSRMRKGDEHAARALWSRHAPRLTAYARAILARADPAGVPDIVQSVFLAALRAPRAEARAINDVPAWLLRLTRNLALNRLRALRRERSRLKYVVSQGAAGVPPPGAARPCPPPDPDLSAALASLPRPLREVVTLKHAAGLSFDQMSAALSQNRNTIAARYRRAIALLRAHHGLDPARPSEVLHAES